MTPKAIRDAANGPWEGDSLPQEDLGPRRVQSPERKPGPGEYHFPADCPIRGGGISLTHRDTLAPLCPYCLRRR